MTTIIFTQHARQRMNERGFTRADILLALALGKKVYADKSLYVFLGKRHLSEFGNLAEKLEGLTLVIDPKSRALLTVYRNRRWLEKIRYKQRRFRCLSAKNTRLN